MIFCDKIFLLSYNAPTCWIEFICYHCGNIRWRLEVFSHRIGFSFASSEMSIDFALAALNRIASTHFNSKSITGTMDVVQQWRFTTRLWRSLKPTLPVVPVPRWQSRRYPQTHPGLGKKVPLSAEVSVMFRGLQFLVWTNEAISVGVWVFDFSFGFWICGGTNRLSVSISSFSK